LSFFEIRISTRNNPYDPLKMNTKSKALASILISFVVATLTISVAPNIDSKGQSKAVLTEKNTSAFHWGEGEI